MKLESPSTIVFAERLERLIEERGLSRNEVCAICGCKKHALAGWLNGTSHPNLDSYVNLCNSLGIGLEELLT
jgi:transcriptional regulator with XRE-family HTH domain